MCWHAILKVPGTKWLLFGPLSLRSISLFLKCQRNDSTSPKNTASVHILALTTPSTISTLTFTTSPWSFNSQTTKIITTSTISNCWPTPTLSYVMSRFYSSHQIVFELSVVSLLPTCDLLFHEPRYVSTPPVLTSECKSKTILFPR